MIHPLQWLENGVKQQCSLLLESELSPPKDIFPGDDRLTAADFESASSQGAGFVWRGDFQNAKQLLQAVGRRLDKKNKPLTESGATLFHRHRQRQSHRAQILSRLLIPVESDFSIPLRRAPDAKLALQQILPTQNMSFLISLRELLGFIGAFEWRKKGVEIEELGVSITPYYGVFSPKRGEYLSLIAKAPLPQSLAKNIGTDGVETVTNHDAVAVDVGTGTGVIAAILAKRGFKRVIGTDTDGRALECARANIQRLGLQSVIQIEQANLFPNTKADLLVCNPPWLPAKPTSSIESALYDPDSRMLRGFLGGVSSSLKPGGEAWLILSDLAERLELRKSGELHSWIDEGGLKTLETLSIRPTHPKAVSSEDPLHAARAKEITHLWRLALQ